MLSLLEQSRIKGRAEGRAEGREEGRAEGVLRASRTILGNFLRARFKNVPESILNHIEEISDEDLLNNLIIKASECKTIEEFQDKFF